MNITKYPMDIKMMINECYEQLYAHKFDKFNEMDQFPERHILLNSHRKKETIWKNYIY